MAASCCEGKSFKIRVEGLWDVLPPLDHGGGDGLGHLDLLCPISKRSFNEVVIMTYTVLTGRMVMLRLDSGGADLAV